MANQHAQIEEYETVYQQTVNQTFRPAYHFAPEFGWINDPNGLVFYRGETHIFCQYHPLSTAWGPMHWAHAVTRDNCAFRSLPVALAPDAPDETGCFSGGAAVFEDKLVCLYTKHFEKRGEVRETQGLAESTDGVHFVKLPNPVLTPENLPAGLSRSDFRDPNPIEFEGRKFVLVGAKTEKDEGRIVVFETDDYRSFRLKSVLESPYFGKMGECPDLFRLDGKDVLIVSAVALGAEARRFRNVNSSVALIGQFDPVDGKYSVESAEEIDGGHDFYAPQTLIDGEGRRIMFAWMNMWGKSYYLHEENHGWNGALTYPRELRVKDGNLLQMPAPGIERYRRAATIGDGGRVTKTSDATFRISPGGSVRFSHPDHARDYIELGLEGTDFYIDPAHTRLSPQEKRFARNAYPNGVKVRMLMDRSSVELFLEDGIETVTTNFFIQSELVSVTFDGAFAEEFYALEIGEKE